MSSLSKNIKAIDATITKIRRQMSRASVRSDGFFKFSKKVFELVQRRKLLTTYTVEMAERIEGVNVNIDQKIENLEFERKERIAKIVDEYEDKTAKLPVIADVDLVVEEKPEPQKFTLAKAETVLSTAETVKMYAKKYSVDCRHVPAKNNFFHAVSCSFWEKYVSTENENCIDSRANYVMSKAKLSPDTKYPLSLAEVDRIIHLLGGIKRHFVVLDTSLRVILTNLPEVIPSTCYPHLVIYDSETSIFSPISKCTKEGKFMCLKCFRFQSISHECKRHCPICLRSREVLECSKPFAESSPILCSKCGAFCQTSECYNAHTQICPRPVQKLHDDVLTFIKSLDTNSNTLPILFERF